ncbi:MAG: class I SAM-dependent methyltransferase [Acidimicrobiia bacterium]|jgi:SAM-dependent methyltransferase
MTELPDYVAKSRENWDRWAPEWVEMGERAWTQEPDWGIWGIPESRLRLLPDDMTGMQAIELGCGTAYVSAWMARRGARCIGVDNSEKQLETARRLAGEHGIEMEFLHGNAEELPYPDASFDFAISEYGAAIWADPYLWVPEAARVLRSGGELVFLGNHPLLVLTQPRDSDAPAGRELLYSYFGMHRVDWDDGEEAGSDFHLPVSEWIRLFAETGFEIVAYHELQSPTPGPETRFYVSADWAYDYPSEQVWHLRKR